MDQQEIKTLKLFEALDENDSQSQRELSKKLEISLGLVNALLKRIVKKGFFKVISTDKSRLRYSLTPKGISEKSILSYQYILYSIKYYSDTRNKIKILFDKLKELKMKKIVFFGAGELAEIAYITAKETNLDVVGMINAQNIGINFLDLPIFDLSILSNNHCDAIIITDIENALKIKDSLVHRGVARTMIFEVI